MNPVLKSFLLLIGLLVLAYLVSLAELFSQIPRYKKFWEKQNGNSIPENALIYVALGDSTAQGIGATSPRRGYVGQLEESLSQKYQRPVHTINLSKSGARLEDCIDEQLPKLATLNPDIVTIEIGANDMQSYEPERFRKEMAVIIAGLPDGTVISDMPYFGGGRRSASDQAAQDASAIIRELAAERSLEVAALYNQTKVNNHLNTYAPDFFHPSSYGYKNWHNAFWDVLKTR